MRILNELSHSRDGESPLSFSDLIDRGTFDLELAAWLMSHVSRGASFIVGAGPGGVGKTTTMRSLLSLAPSKLPFGIALPEKIEKRLRRAAQWHQGRGPCQQRLHRGQPQPVGT